MRPSSPSSPCLSALIPIFFTSILVLSTLRLTTENAFLNQGLNHVISLFSPSLEKSKSAKSARAEHDNVLEHGCNLFEGKWVLDEQNSRPLYSEDSCPYLTRQVTCRRNGRPDSLYQKWRWKPNSCEMPRFESILSYYCLCYGF